MKITTQTPNKFKQKVSQRFPILLEIVNDQKKSIKLWPIKVWKSKMAVIGRENLQNPPKLPKILQLNHDFCL